MNTIYILRARGIENAFYVDRLDAIDHYLDMGAAQQECWCTVPCVANGPCLICNHIIGGENCQCNQCITARNQIIKTDEDAREIGPAYERNMRNH
jgi:hypothetical protein